MLLDKTNSTAFQDRAKDNLISLTFHQKPGPKTTAILTTILQIQKEKN